MSLMGIDMGTTGCKAGVFSLDGKCIASAYREYHILHKHEGWAELDSRKVMECAKEVIRETALTLIFHVKNEKYQPSASTRPVAYLP